MRLPQPQIASCLAIAVPQAERHIPPVDDHSPEPAEALCVLHPPPSLRLRLWRAITSETGP